MLSANCGIADAIKEAFRPTTKINIDLLLVNNEGLDGGGVWYSLFIKILAHYSSH